MFGNFPCATSTRALFALTRFTSLFCILALLLAGCSGEGEAREAGTDADRSTAARRSAPNGETAQDERLPVEVVTLERGRIESVLRFSTNLEAESEVQVFSQAARLVTALLVEEGARVRKGDLLLRLQDDEQRGELTRVESQLAKAQREYERQEKLFSRELISEQAMNDATYEVDQLRLALDDARRNLSYTEVRAPISGTVTGRYVNLGDHITVNQHLFDIVDFDTIVARVYVPENELPRLRTGQPARIYSRSVGAASVGERPSTDVSSAAARTGEVIRIAPIVDPKSGTVKVTVGIPSSQQLRPGMYVEVELVTAVHEDALLVPKRAVVYDDNQTYVYRLTSDLRAEKLRLAVQLEDRDAFEPAPGSALAAGDEVVVAGQAGLKDGIAVRRAAGASAGAAPADAIDALPPSETTAEHGG